MCSVSDLRFYHSAAAPLIVATTWQICLCNDNHFDRHYKQLSLYCTFIISHHLCCCVLHCVLFTPADRSTTSTPVGIGSCERSCQKQKHHRVPAGALEGPTGSWWYTSTTHSRWEEEVQSWKRSHIWSSLHWALSSWWVLRSHAVSVLCQSSPQSVVPEKQPLPPQLAVLVGWTCSLLCLDHAPPVGCNVWPPPVEWASCSDMSPLSVLVCFPNAQVTPHQVVLLPQQNHNQPVRTQSRTWTGLRSMALQRAVHIAPFATQCHSCPVGPVLSFAVLVLSCKLSACDCLSVHCLTCPYTGHTRTH